MPAETDTALPIPPAGRRTWPAPHAATGVGTPGFVAAHVPDDPARTEATARVMAALDQVDLVHLAFADPHGLARSKTLTTGAFRSALANGMDFSPGPFLFDTGHAIAVDFQADAGLGVPELRGAGDFVLVPDPTTFQVLPGREPRTAWVLGEEYLRSGRPHPLSGRGALRRVLARYAEHGLSPVVGLELEWYLTHREPGPVGNAGNGFGRQGRAPAVSAVNAGYQFNLDGMYHSVAPVADPLALRLLALDLPLRSMEHESGPGQLETTFDPMGALDAADAMILARTTIKQFCAERGFHASFMSLPALDGFDASGWHLHQSVTDTATGANVFATGPGGGRAGRLGAAISERAVGYLDGLLARARDLCLLSVPTVNGYRRLRPEFSLAPTRVGASIEDRTAMVRVIGDGPSTHLENRIGEPCANPYLAMTAQLAAGLDGLLARGTDGTGAPEIVPDGAVGPADPGRRACAAAELPSLPVSLADSLDAFETGPAAVLLGAPLAGCLTRLKRSELDRFRAWCAEHDPAPGVVTDWEQREYFDVF